jgi:hypothetical protein
MWFALSDIRSVEVELWLKNLHLAPGSRCKIRNVMSLLFNHGHRHDLCEGYDHVLGVDHPEIPDLTDSAWQGCNLRDEAGAG